MHLGDVGRDILEQHASPVRHLHVRSAAEGTQECGGERAQVDVGVLGRIVEAEVGCPVVTLLDAVGTLEDWQTRGRRLLRVCQQEGIVAVVPRNGRPQEVGPESRPSP